MELAAAVAAERHQDEGRRRQPCRLRVLARQVRERADEVIHEARVGADGVFARGALGVAPLERLEPLGERAAEKVEPPATPILGALCPGLGAPGPTIELGRHDDVERISPRRLMSMRTQS